VATNVTAPIPGKILAVKVEPGKQVKKGDLLITLEAMKMENYIEAPGRCSQRRESEAR